MEKPDKKSAHNLFLVPIISFWWQTWSLRCVWMTCHSCSGFAGGSTNHLGAPSAAILSTQARGGVG